MGLSKPRARDHIHTRDIKCFGYKRLDGLWDIECSLIDTKTYSFSNVDRGGVSSGEPIHHMQIRVTLNNDLIVKQAEAATIDAPYSICPSVAPKIKDLKGLKIGPGWRNQVKNLLGGVNGCTHLRDILIGPLAVTAYQTIIPSRDDNEYRPKNKERPQLLNTCAAFSQNSPVVKERWPDYYLGEPKNTN